MLFMDKFYGQIVIDFVMLKTLYKGFEDLKKTFEDLKKTKRLKNSDYNNFSCNFPY